MPPSTNSHPFSLMKPCKYLNPKHSIHYNLFAEFNRAFYATMYNHSDTPKNAKTPAPGPILSFLRHNKTRLSRNSSSSDTSQKMSETSTCGCVSDSEQPSTTLTTFKITSYHIDEAVEYQVLMTESTTIRGRNIDREYTFTTRYSKLAKLYKDLSKRERLDFPEKRLFGNKNHDFILKRMQRLEIFLNKAASLGCLEIQKFLEQVKSVPVRGSLLL